MESRHIAPPPVHPHTRPDYSPARTLPWNRGISNAPKHRNLRKDISRPHRPRIRKSSASNMLLNVVAAAASLLAIASAHNIQMKAYMRECFHEQLHKDDKMTVTFQVGDREFGGSGNLDIDFWVQPPSLPLQFLLFLNPRVALLHFTIPRNASDVDDRG